MNTGKRPSRPVTAMSIKMIAKVTSYDNGQLCGSLDSIYFQVPLSFSGVVEMIEIMETAFDALGFPDKALLPRTFGKAKERMRRSEMDIEKLISQRKARGRAKPGSGQVSTGNGCTSSDEPLAVFEIFVNFRLNAEWQGRLCHIDSGKDSEFSSIVGMVKLLDEALTP